MLSIIFGFFALITLMSFFVTLLDIYTVSKNKDLIPLAKSRIIMTRLFFAVSLLIVSSILAVCSIATI